MNLRARLEQQAADAGHPNPQIATPTELLDVIDKARQARKDDKEAAK